MKTYVMICSVWAVIPTAINQSYCNTFKHFVPGSSVGGLFVELTRECVKVVVIVSVVLRHHHALCYGGWVVKDAATILITQQLVNYTERLRSFDCYNQDISLLLIHLLDENYVQIHVRPITLTGSYPACLPRCSPWGCLRSRPCTGRRTPDGWTCRPSG